MANSIPHHRDVRTLAHVDLTYPNDCAALSRLLDVALLPAAENDLPRILQIVISDVRDTVGCERVRWFVIDDVTQELYTRVATELENSEIRHKLGKGITGRVAQHRQQTHVPHPSGEESWDPTTDYYVCRSSRVLISDWSAGCRCSISRVRDSALSTSN